MKTIAILDENGRKVDEIKVDVEDIRFKRNVAQLIHNLKTENDQLKGENIMQKRANADLEDNINFLKDVIKELKDENGGLECRIIDIKGENNLLKSEISKRDKMIKSLTDYIEALQKSRTPVVFTATKDELKEVQEFIAKHVL